MKLEELFKFYMEFPAFDEVDLQSVNQCGPFGQFPIHLAASRGVIEELTVLISNGADIDIRGEHGLSPLHLATLRDNTEAVLLLLHSGCDPNIKNDWKQTPLDMAKASKNHSEDTKKIISILLEYTSRVH